MQNILKIAIVSLLLAKPAFAESNSLRHCDTVEDIIFDGWLTTADESTEREDHPTTDINPDTIQGLAELDVSTLETPLDLRIALPNAQHTRLRFVISEEVQIRLELVPDKPGPHGELQIDLFTQGGRHFFRDYDNGMYHDYSWQTKHDRSVPRIDLTLPTGEYMMTLCNSYVSDGGVMRIGLSDHEALTKKTTHPLVRENDL